jgi:hypothetical protein
VPAARESNVLLSVVRSIGSILGVQVRNPKWTTYGSLEVDLFAASKSDVSLFLAAILPLCKIEFSKDLSKAPQHRPSEETVLEAKTLFNAERYWECHEVLEGLWRTAKGEDRLFLQGIILVCAAFVHHQKAEDQIALGILERAERQLSSGARGYCSLESSGILREVRKDLQSGFLEPFEI